MTGYSAFRTFEESLRVDYSQYFLGLRLNFFVASVLTLIGIIWFILIQQRPTPAEPSDDSPQPDSTDSQQDTAEEQTPRETDTKSPFTH